ncbi:MAG TPA: ATP-binding protein [Candidatus Polarisedimenticolaceae bacterium]|nr:ATP-binding protein [Candidatus Polarisedimenticolaceae bacterium]
MSRIAALTRSLAFRLAAPLSLAMIAIAAGVGVYLGRSVRDEGLRELGERAELLASTLAANAELPLLAGDADALTALLTAARADVDVLDAAVLARDGRVVARVGEARPGSAGAIEVQRAVATAQAGSAKDESAFALDRGAVAARREIGRVRLTVSTARTTARTRRIQEQIAAVGAALLALAIGLGLVIVRIVGRPLSRLVEATRRIARGEVSVRVEASSRDEIGELARSFNRMAEDLEKTRAELEEERRELERRVVARTEELSRAQQTLVHAEKMTAVGQLVAGVAHELNNPLTVVLGYAGLLAERNRDPAIQKKLEMLAAAAESSRKIVQNLLAFARKQKPERARLDVNDVVQKTLSLRSYHLRTEKIAVDTRLDPRLPATWADPQQIQQVVLNLLVNAEQAIEASGHGDRIGFTTRAVEGGIDLVVEDNGPGIPPEVRSRIFEPFFTTKEVGKGTGLGLSICYGIVAEHGGEIRVESEPGQFTRFTLNLPVAPPSVLATAEPAERAPEAIAAALSVLIVDDDPAVLEFVEEAMQGEGFRIETARGGREAIKRLSTGAGFDAVVSDLRMPDVDGRGLFRYIREQRPELEARLGFATGDVANPTSRKFLESSGRPVLEKPFTIAALRDTVRKLSGGAR